MKEDLTYTRTISQEEAREGYFMVLKDHLSFFPMIGTPFTLQLGNRGLNASVEKYHCECRGPEKPHDHYFVRHKGLREGDTIVLRRDAKKSARYILSVRSQAAKRELCG